MDAVERLQEHNIKLSVQRIAIMDYLMKHCTHPTVDDIYTALSPTIPTLSKTTVYNTLRLLSEEGAVQTLTIDEKNTCYDADGEPHAHFLCKSCGKIYDVEYGDQTHSSPSSRMLSGHQVQEVHRYYKGICRDCLKKDPGTR